MGGYYSGSNADDPRHGINDFKKSFGGQVRTHYNYRRDYSLLFRMARRVQESFRPPGRKVG
jgi:hypothetical protein